MIIDWFNMKNWNETTTLKMSNTADINFITLCLVSFYFIKCYQLYPNILCFPDTLLCEESSSRACLRGCSSCFNNIKATNEYRRIRKCIQRTKCGKVLPVHFFLLRELENCILSRLEWTKKVTTLLKQ